MTTNAPRSDDRMHTWRRWSVFGFATAACVLGVGDAWTPPPVGTAIAGECFPKRRLHAPAVHRRPKPRWGQYRSAGCA